jgi:hypothetical protein
MRIPQKGKFEAVLFKDYKIQSSSLSLPFFQACPLKVDQIEEI